VSQARLATATGIGQGRLNEIINGHRQVARLDVLERIAGGLAMPDDARVLFGLAPVHAETLTGHAEISRVFTGQAEANAELREQAGSPRGWTFVQQPCLRADRPGMAVRPQPVRDQGLDFPGPAQVARPGPRRGRDPDASGRRGWPCPG
jgi:transcriptional regulator with XRE-family HTH domain